MCNTGIINWTKCIHPENPVYKRLWCAEDLECQMNGYRVRQVWSDCQTIHPDRGQGYTLDVLWTQSVLGFTELAMWHIKDSRHLCYICVWKKICGQSMWPLCTDWIHQTPYGGTLLLGHVRDADLVTRSVSEMKCLVHQTVFNLLQFGNFPLVYVLLPIVLWFKFVLWKSVGSQRLWMGLKTGLYRQVEFLHTKLETKLETNISLCQQGCLIY